MAKRVSNLAYYRSLAEIQILSSSSDGYGGSDDNWVNLYDDEHLVRCRIERKGGRMDILDERTSFPYSHVAMFDIELDETLHRVMIDDEIYTIMAVFPQEGVRRTMFYFVALDMVR